MLTTSVSMAPGRASFQIESFNMNESVTKHIDGSLALLQHDVADKRLKVTVLGHHVHEDDLAEDRFKTLDLDAHGTKDNALHGRLRCQLKLNSSNLFQVAESITPG